MNGGRVLYFSQGYSVHDERFLVRISDWMPEVYFLPNEGLRPGSRPLPPGVRSVSWKSSPDWSTRVAEFRTILADVKPDLVHAGPLPSCAALASDAGVGPLLVMSWGSDILRFKESAPEDQSRIRRALAGAQGYVGDCHTVRDAMVEVGGIDPRRVVLFPWGIDLAHFNPGAPDRNWRQELGIGSRMFLLHTRSMSKTYGVHVLIEAIAKVRRPDLHLVFIGDGPDRADLLRQAKEQGVAHQITHIPTLANDELRDVFRSADAYVTCSPTDGTSISMLEAMAVGLVVIVPDISSNREWIKEGRNGWLFPPGNPEALAAVLGKCTPDSRIREANAQLAIRRANWKMNSAVLQGKRTGASSEKSTGLP